jgi:hypothetical protein
MNLDCQKPFFYIFNPSYEEFLVLIRVSRSENKVQGFILYSFS